MSVNVISHFVNWTNKDLSRTESRGQAQKLNTDKDWTYKDKDKNWTHKDKAKD